MAVAKDYQHDERVIGAFLCNYRMVDVMRDSGLSKNIVYKLKNDQEFQKVIRARKEAILQTAVNKMQSYMVKDVEILQGIIEDPATAAQTKINGIQTLFNQLRDWTTTVDLQKRLEALENPSENVSGTFYGGL